GSFNAAPLANVILTTLLYVSPVQIIPPWDQTGVPFHSSTTSGSACWIRARRRESSSPRQSPSSWILASISRDADSTLWEPLFFMMSACFPPELLFFAGFLAFSAMFYNKKTNL